MRSVNAGAAIAVSMPVMLLLSACSGEITPERAAAAYPPQPVIFPLQPPVPQVGNAPGGVRTALVRWFSEAGYKDFQVEALAEHAKIERGFRPCAAAPGLRYTYQWGGARLRRLRWPRCDGVLAVAAADQGQYRTCKDIPPRTRRSLRVCLRR